MKIKNYLFTLIPLLLVITACEGRILSQVPAAAKKGAADYAAATLSPQSTVSPAKEPSLEIALSESERAKLLNTLDEIAELERSGSRLKGMALTESALRENAGDYSGAVAAAYKELTWSYGLGLIKKEDVENGLLNVLAAKNEESVKVCASAILDFMNEKWDNASFGLKHSFEDSDEIDGIGNWMLLVCAMEKNKFSSENNNIFSSEKRRAGETYKSIRARYSNFPEYWYRGARAFSGLIAAQYAENCINISPSGPFAEECRSILAAFTGLKNEDSLSIKTKMEIENIITLSVNSNNPESLNLLFPLISLPDNPYTVYAVGALRGLTSAQKFREYFIRQAASSKGRLSERLSYICRG